MATAVADTGSMEIALMVTVYMAILPADTLRAIFILLTAMALGAASDNAAYAAVFFAGVYSSVGFFTSDRNLKKNIEDFGSAMSVIDQLTPKTL